MGRGSRGISGSERASNARARSRTVEVELSLSSLNRILESEPSILGQGKSHTEGVG